MVFTTYFIALILWIVPLNARYMAPCPGNVYVQEAGSLVGLEDIRNKNVQCPPLESNLYFINESSSSKQDHNLLDIGLYHDKIDSLGVSLNISWVMQLRNSFSKNTFPIPDKYTLNISRPWSSGTAILQHFCSYEFCTDEIPKNLLQRDSKKLEFYFTGGYEPRLKKINYTIRIPGSEFHQSPPLCNTEYIKVNNVWPYGAAKTVNCGISNYLPIEYNIPMRYARNEEKANLYIGWNCSTPSLSSCNGWKEPLLHNRSGIYNFMMPNMTTFDTEYSIHVSGEDPGFNCLLPRANYFAPCKEDDTASPVSIPLLVICGVLVLLLIAAFLILGFKVDWKMGNFKPLIRPPPITQTVVDIRGPEVPIKLLIVFLDEHPKHRDVILNFATYLEADLQFEVKLDLYELEQIYSDPVGWLDKSLKLAEKVLVIWSPGASDKLSSTGNNFGRHDMFTPTLRTIKQDLVLHNNQDKYFFGYFDYCSKEDIPIDFQNDALTHFILMEEFENLYFKLNNFVEHYPGKALKNDKASCNRYFDPDLTNYGEALKKSIDEMCEFVKANPDWCNDTIANEPDDSSLSYLHNSDKNVLEIENILPILPPPDLQGCASTRLNEHEVHEPSVSVFAPAAKEPQIEHHSYACHDEPAFHGDVYRVESLFPEKRSSDDAMNISQLLSCSSSATAVRESDSFQCVPETRITIENAGKELCPSIKDIDQDEIQCNSSRNHDDKIYSVDEGYSTYLTDTGYFNFNVNQSPNVANISSAPGAVVRPKPPPPTLAPIDMDTDPMHSLFMINASYK